MSKIPKEDWPRVREMRERGLTMGQIALKLGCKRYHVDYALNPDRQRNKGWYPHARRRERAQALGFPTYHAYLKARKENHVKELERRIHELEHQLKGGE